MTRRLSAIVAFDSPDLEELRRRDERAALASLRRRDEVLLAGVTGHGGSVRHSIGDVSFASFESAVSAVECALWVQQRLGDEALPLRACVQIGDLLANDQTGFSAASRLLHLVPTGKSCVTREVRSVVEGKVRCGFRDLGSSLLELSEPDDGAPARVGHGPIRLVVPPEPPKQKQPPEEPKKEEPPRKQMPPPPAAAGPLQAILWVDHPNLMLERVGGIPIIERQIITLSKVGFRRIWVSTVKPKGKGIEQLRIPAGIELHWVEPTGGDDEVRSRIPACQPPYITVSADYFFRPRVLGQILSKKHEAPTAYQDISGKGVIQVVPYRQQVVQRHAKLPLPDEDYVLLKTDAARGPAVPWLLRDMVKPQDSFMARHFDRRISMAVTRRLAETWVSPNHMTVFSTAIGLAGASLFASGTYLHTVAAALIVWLHTVLDGCDGELARLRFQSSRLGGILDFWGDNLVHAVLFVSMGVGLGRPVFILLGLVAAASALACAALIYAHSAQRAEREKEGPLFRGLEDLGKSWAAKIEHILSQRDFIYLLVLLALTGRTDVFLWAAGIGTPLFLIVFLLLRPKSYNVESTGGT
ncbi:MAG: CDP-alcohol phosphatidyltransferase family protein [Elusimicrobiota bacterium]